MYTFIKEITAMRTYTFDFSVKILAKSIFIIIVSITVTKFLIGSICNGWFTFSFFVKY